MRKILGLKLKTLQFMDSIHGTLKDTVQEAATQQVDISTNALSVNINKVEHSGLSLYLKGMLLSEEVKNDYQSIRGVHKYTEKTFEHEAYFNLIVDIKEGSASGIAEGLNKLVESPEVKPLIDMFLKGAKISIIAEGNRLNLCLPFPAKVAVHMVQYQDLIKTI